MSDFSTYLFDFIVHIDQHLAELVSQYQYWAYLFLFLIIYSETGFVVLPFLPGDTLLFATGAIAALDGNPLNIYIVVVLLIVAGFLGDNTSYVIGRSLGHKIYKRDFKIMPRKHIDKTHAFYEKHGGKMLLFARFMPIVRAFAPFVAGIGEMPYHRFIRFSIVGNILWVCSLCFAGFLFGNIPSIKDNFIIAIGIITFISFMPAMYTLVKQLFGKTR